MFSADMTADELASRLGHIATGEARFVFALSLGDQYVPCASVAGAYPALGASRDKSDCHFRKTATKYYRKPGIKWLSCTAK